MKKTDALKAWFVHAIGRLIEDAIDSPQPIDWADDLLSLPPGTPAILIQALHGWIRTIRDAAGERDGYVHEGVVCPEFWHCPPYSKAILALIREDYLFPGQDGATLGFTLFGLRLALEAEALDEILQKYPLDDIGNAVTTILDIRKANGTCW